MYFHHGLFRLLLLEHLRVGCLSFFELARQFGLRGVKGERDRRLFLLEVIGRLVCSFWNACDLSVCWD